MLNILVTGGSRGIWDSIANKLLDEWNRVFWIWRTSSKITHKNFVFYKMDLRDENNIKKLSSMMIDVDVLINNAWVGYFKTLENLSADEINEIIDLNIRTSMLLTSLLIWKLKKSKWIIINIWSQSGLRWEKFGTAYCASKFALRWFSESLFSELRNDWIRVSHVNPWIVKSSFFDDKHFWLNNDELYYVEPDDIAKVVLDILNLRRGSVVKEISVYPQKHGIIKK